MLTVNNTVLQKHQLMGPVGYEAQGTPTIADGVVSGFDRTTGSYLWTSGEMPMSDNYELVFKVHTPASNVRGALFYARSGGRFSLFVTSSSVLHSEMFDSDGQYHGLNGTTALQPNTDYWIKYTYSNNVFSQYVSTDGQTYHLESSLAIELGESTSHYKSFIGYYSSSQVPWQGSIDLNKTYIKVNGKLWFYQPQETKRIVVNGVEVWTKPV